jgi:branched-chain amino acid transport system ATP-binding protein
MNSNAIETEDLSVNFGGVTAVNSVNFKLKLKELRCLIGPNGAGKSTFFKSITGQIPAPNLNGKILIRGVEINGLEPHEIVRMGIGIKTQVPSVMKTLTVYENLWLGARRTHKISQVNNAISFVIEEFGLSDITKSKVGELSHGQAQIVEIGLVIIQKPWLILLDEPAAGLTGEEVEKLAIFIKKINEKSAVIVVDHDMEFVRMLNTDITVFHQGVILKEGSTYSVLNDPEVIKVYIGERAQ